MPRKQYSVLQGLVRDIERALDESGTEEWKLLSTFSNLLFAIEEADLAESTGEDTDDDLADPECGGSGDAGASPDGPVPGRVQLPLPGVPGVGADVPRGTNGVSRNGPSVAGPGPRMNIKRRTVVTDG